VANQNIPSDVYPFATQDGKPIPLDILGAKGVLIQDFVVGATAPMTIPDSKEVGIAYANEDCFLILDDGVEPVVAITGITNNTLQENAFFIPANHAVAIRLVAGEARVIALDSAGRLVIQFIERWSGLDLDISYERR
jgi:hypothetical protein